MIQLVRSGAQMNGEWVPTLEVWANDALVVVVPMVDEKEQIHFKDTGDNPRMSGEAFDHSDDVPMKLELVIRDGTGAEWIVLDDILKTKSPEEIRDVVVTWLKNTKQFEEDEGLSYPMPEWLR